MLKPVSATINVAGSGVTFNEFDWIRIGSIATGGSISNSPLSGDGSGETTGAGSTTTNGRFAELLVTEVEPTGWSELESMAGSGGGSCD